MELEEQRFYSLDLARLIGVMITSNWYVSLYAEDGQAFVVRKIWMKKPSYNARQTREDHQTEASVMPRDLS